MKQRGLGAGRRPAVGAALILAVTVGGARGAWAEDRPSEQDLFGAPSAPPATPPAAAAQPAAGSASATDSASAPAAPAATPGEPPAAAGGGTARDQELLGNSPDAKFLSDYVAPDNPLQIGGQLYLRAQSTAYSGQSPGSWTFDAPNLLDVYLDARPNPRVRAFILGRMEFDPTLLPSTSMTGTTSAMTSMGSTGMTSDMSNGALAGNGLSATGFSGFSSSRGPNSLLDQMWIRFDILQKVFVTVGKQHVRWGTGKFWQPTDYLHPIKRNPLDVFDARPGNTMIKVNIPWEEEGWNFYGFGIAEDPNVATGTLGQVAGAARAEVVVAGVEAGGDIYLHQGSRPRYGFDLSTGIYDFDVYTDIAIRPGSDFLYDFPGQGITGFTGYETQAVGGISYEHKYNDNDMWSLGFEYFYNHPGYTSASAYPRVLADAFAEAAASTNPALAGNPLAAFPFFYLGRQYAALSLSLPAPYSWNYTTFTLTTLSNLSDESFLTRLDYSVTFLTHLSFQAFVGVHYGHVGGELRFELPQLPPAIASMIPSTTPLNDYPVVDLGAALLIKL